MSDPALVGVGVGPGDPELITVLAVRVLRAADLVVVPVLDPAATGRAEAVVRAHLDPPPGAGADRVRRVVFAMNERTDLRRREAAWDAAAAVVADAFGAGARTVAFATIGDPNVYSTFTYLAQTVQGRVPGVAVATVPGITAIQDLAARSGTVLCEGREPLTLLPATAGLDAVAAALGTAGTVVAYKAGRWMPEVRDLLRRHDRLAGAVYGAALGLPDQDIRPVAELPDGPAPYLSTVIVPGRRGGRGSRL